MKRILVLFPKEWDRLEFSRPEYAGRYEFVYAGFDLFRFPENLRLATFDVFRFVGELVQRFRGARLDGVFSNNEYFGALVAAVVAEKLGLPGNHPRVVLTAQHKFYARKAFAEAAPEAAPRFAAFPYDVRDRGEFPFALVHRLHDQRPPHDRRGDPARASGEHGRLRARGKRQRARRHRREPLSRHLCLPQFRVSLARAGTGAGAHARAAPQFRHAASFALRKFDGKPLAAHPTAEQIAGVGRDFPEARLMLYLKRGLALANEMKWLGSYRYAVVNLAAASSADLHQRCRELRQRLFADSDLSA